MTGFGVEPETLDQVGARFHVDVSGTQRSIADQVQGSAQSAMNVGDVAAAAGLQQRWHGWVQTRFEDLQATDDLITGIGVALQETAREYRQSDNGVADDLGHIGDDLGGGVR
ncbi:MAG: hypothetical protein M3257_05335 [Actinomycetota bacterium]|nr:hypothetical protein [Actinomycetota bacterium]